MHLVQVWQWIKSFWKPRSQAQSEDYAKSSEPTRSTKPSDGRKTKGSAEVQTRMGDPGFLGDKSTVRFRAAEHSGITKHYGQKVSANGTQETRDKGNLELLRGKEYVAVQTACKFGGVKQRAIQAAIAKGSLDAVGKRQNRKISVASLLKSFPPENSAH